MIISDDDDHRMSLTGPDGGPIHGSPSQALKFCNVVAHNFTLNFETGG